MGVECGMRRSVVCSAYVCVGVGMVCSVGHVWWVYVHIVCGVVCVWYVSCLVCLLL